MDRILPDSVKQMANVLERLPGIGPKTASRLTFFLINQDPQVLKEFEKAFNELKKDLKICSICQVVSSSDPCLICSDSSRQKSLLAVVEETLDVLALERASFGGVYHVLGGQISPMNNIASTDLTIDLLIKRLTNDLEKQEIKEVILATDPSLEGEATALFILNAINQAKQSGQIAKSLTVTRIARGLPTGGDLEYADELTLSRALEGEKGVCGGVIFLYNKK